MNEQRIFVYKSLAESQSSASQSAVPSIEPATCTEAEPFVLRVLDDSMEPEFRRNCMIVIDPTGRATHGSFVIAEVAEEALFTDAGDKDTAADDSESVGKYIFRQLLETENNSWNLAALNKLYPEQIPLENLESIVGVVVQRAGVRRRYHKRYD